MLDVLKDMIIKLRNTADSIEEALPDLDKDMTEKLVFLLDMTFMTLRDDLLEVRHNITSDED